MAIDPTRLAIFKQPARNWAGLLSQANSYRNLDGALFVMAFADTDGIVWPADDLASASCLLAQWTPANTPAVAIVGPCEISDDRLDYRDYDPAEVRRHFEQFDIIIREACPEVKFGTP